MLISGTFCQILSKLQSLVPAYAISKKKAKQHRCRVRAYSVAKTDAVREVSSPEWVTFSPQTISDATPVWCRSVGKTGEQNDSTRFARSTSNTFVCGAFFSRCDVDFVTEYAVTNFECRAQYHELWTRTFKDDQSRFFFHLFWFSTGTCTIYLFLFPVKHTAVFLGYSSASVIHSTSACITKRRLSWRLDCPLNILSYHCFLVVAVEQSHSAITKFRRQKKKRWKVIYYSLQTIRNPSCA